MTSENISKEGLRLKTEWIIDRFKDPDGVAEKMLRRGLSVDEVKDILSERYVGQERIQGNVALNEGLQQLIDIIIAADNEATKKRWGSTNAYIGVGNSNQAEVPGDTGLIGASKAYMPMDGTFPSRAGQVASWRSTFGSGDANFAWEEYTVINESTDAGQNLNRKTASKGTKVAGETWTMTVNITFS